MSCVKLFNSSTVVCVKFEVHLVHVDEHDVVILDSEACVCTLSAFLINVVTESKFFYQKAKIGSEGLYIPCGARSPWRSGDQILK